LPHIIIEFSSNLEVAIDIASLAEAMHENAASLDSLPTGGIRTRCVARHIYRIADGHPDNGFISVLVRIARGRSDEEKKIIGDSLFTTLIQHVDFVFKHRPLSLALEIQEINPDTRWKQSNIREYMQERHTRSGD